MLQILGKKIVVVKIGILRLINIKRIMLLFVLKQICHDYLFPNGMSIQNALVILLHNESLQS